MQASVSVYALTLAVSTCRCTLPWADDPDEAEYASYVYSLPCKLSENALPGYYNVSATVADVFGAAEPHKPFFEMPSSQSSAQYSLNTFWTPRNGVPGVHMVQVQLGHDPQSLFSLPAQFTAPCFSARTQEKTYTLCPLRYTRL